MRVYRLLVLLCLTLFSIPAYAQKLSPKDFRDRVYDASLQLYFTPEKTKLVPLPEPIASCTATAFEKIEKGYRLVTAGHCVLDDVTFGSNHDYIPVEKGLSVGYGVPGKQVFIPVKLHSVGNVRKGWDVAILIAETTVKLPVIPLGDSTAVDIGDRIVTVSAPLGGELKQYFEGYVSAAAAQLGPPNLMGEWGRMFFTQIQSNQGSSGAAVVSVTQQEMVGIYIGQFRQETMPYDMMGNAMFPAADIKTFLIEAEHLGIVIDEPVPSIGDLHLNFNGDEENLLPPLPSGRPRF